MDFMVKEDSLCEVLRNVAELWRGELYGSGLSKLMPDGMNFGVIKADS